MLDRIAAFVGTLLNFGLIMAGVGALIYMLVANVAIQ